jgi:acetyltransferase-like isoleucine patch superfamily enzyme
MFKKFLHYWRQFRVALISSPMKRVRYLKKKGYFASVGDRVMIMSRKIPLYSNLIKIGNNVWIASGVVFVTHDVIHHMLNGLVTDFTFSEHFGCIEIGDHVFIGTGSIIMNGVKIGNHTVVAAGSVVTRDVPEGTVVAGVPAKKIGDFDELVAKRIREENIKSMYYVDRPSHKSGIVRADEAEICWKDFVCR